MMNSRGETGDPCGVLTETGAKTLGDLSKCRGQDLPVRKDCVLDTRYGLTLIALSMPQSVVGWTLLKPFLISRKRVETFLLSFWRLLISWVRVLHASATDKPARDSHW